MSAVTDGRVAVRVGALAAAAGFVDAVSFVLLFALFTAHLTGDTTHLGSDIGRNTYGGDAGARIVVIIVFVAAVALATFAVVTAVSARVARRRLLAAEAALLTVFMVAGSYWSDRGELTKGSLAVGIVAACAAAAMGFQNVVVRNAAGTAVSTTFLTGMLMAFGEDLVTWLRDRADLEARRRARLHGGLWVCFFVGTIGGAAAVTRWDLWALVVPIVVVLGSIAADRPPPPAAAPGLRTVSRGK